MGKKRRVLHSPKFAGLRKHPKYRGLASANSKLVENLQEVEEQEVVEETPILKAAEETLNIEPELQEVKPEPILKPKKTTAKASSKKSTTPKKSRTRRTTRKKAATQSP
jgi:hypothetical protein